MTRTHTCIVTQVIAIDLDHSKFTPAFMAEFRESFFPFDTIDDHAEFLAQMCARGIIDRSTKFIEGYGPPADFGIKITHVSTSVDIEETV